MILDVDSGAKLPDWELPPGTLLVTTESIQPLDDLKMCIQEHEEGFLGLFKKYIELSGNVAGFEKINLKNMNK